MIAGPRTWLTNSVVIVPLSATLGLCELKLGTVERAFVFPIGAHGSVTRVSLRFALCTVFANKQRG